jgi:hypothetical protein
VKDDTARLYQAHEFRRPRKSDGPDAASLRPPRLTQAERPHSVRLSSLQRARFRAPEADRGLEVHRLLPQTNPGPSQSEDIRSAGATRRSAASQAQGSLHMAGNGLPSALSLNLKEASGGRLAVLPFLHPHPAVLAFGQPRHFAGHKARSHSQVGFIDIAPGPVLPGLNGFHHRVARLLEVPGGVAAGRGIAAADVAADQAHPERHPVQAGLQALLATLRIGLDRPCLIKVRTPSGHGLSFSRSKIAWSKADPTSLF